MWVLHILFEVEALLSWINAPKLKILLVFITGYLTKYLRGLLGDHVGFVM